LPRLGLSLKATLTYQFAVNLLDTYVGRDAGKRIRSGEIRRGHAEIIRAVVWYADLRGFTALTDTVPTDELQATLDEYFNCMVCPLMGRGGQVLNFIGDGLLATFDLENAGKDSVCREALDSAVEALDLVKRLNAERSAAGQPVMELDLALHLGDVLYGNVGALDRQDFTVIGPAVNEASRIEDQCERLGRNILLSETFAAAAIQCSDRLMSLGRHSLRDVRAPQELFTVKDEGE
jgi:adenylate cyclase